MRQACAALTLVVWQSITNLSASELPGLTRTPTSSRDSGTGSYVGPYAPAYRRGPFVPVPEWRINLAPKQDSMSAPDFVTGFVTAMAEEGYIVQAEISVLPPIYDSG